MYNKQLSKLIAIITIATFLLSCSKDDVTEIGGPDPVDPAAPYANGFFIITEGSYGQTSGTIQFYAYGADTVVTKVYEKENPEKTIANAAKTSTLQFASVYDNKLYLTSKLNGPVIKLDAETLKEEGRYNQETSNWRSLIGTKTNEGLLSASDGVYAINLGTLTPQYKLTSVSAVNTGDMLHAGDYIYILQSNGAKIISANNYSFVKSFSNINRGFAATPNGKVWASTGSRLIAIDKNLDTSGVALPASIGSFGLDAPTRLTASKKRMLCFIIRALTFINMLMAIRSH
ncbi:DUF5074 domain-containing protein [Niabella ginsengisoli]|uniref:DUF5074 domain-containing protein n=1 Tax=Niabella ginsengisoli TaxID=522298 RepID=A0ABS9SNL9_9BACT|nr:DUF5074 domain-containing protein [Niabella ginsengisoli]MCH5599993.1 hypothetical protein [Niabella ginsengisoli]